MGILQIRDTPCEKNCASCVPPAYKTQQLLLVLGPGRLRRREQATAAARRKRAAKPRCRKDTKPPSSNAQNDAKKRRGRNEAVQRRKKTSAAAARCGDAKNEAKQGRATRRGDAKQWRDDAAQSSDAKTRGNNAPTNKRKPQRSSASARACACANAASARREGKRERGEHAANAEMRTLMSEWCWRSSLGNCWFHPLVDGRLIA